METSSVAITFNSVDQILGCVDLIETSLAVLLHGIICFSTLYKMKLTVKSILILKWTSQTNNL